MSQSLDQFIPDESTLVGVRRQLLDAGNVYETLPHAWIPATIAAMQKWMLTTHEGAEYIATLLGMAVVPGEINKHHYIVDPEGQVIDRVRPEDVRRLYGLTVNGQFTPPAALRISEKDREPCDGCSMMGHCLKNVTDHFAPPGERQQQSLCNYCLTHTDNPRLRGEGSQGICDDCAVTSCSHHPSRYWRRSANR